MPRVGAKIIGRNSAEGNMREMRTRGGKFSTSYLGNVVERCDRPAGDDARRKAIDDARFRSNGSSMSHG